MNRDDEMYRIVNLYDKGDERGNLVVVECGKDIPFVIQRVFYMYGSDDTVIRGQHANINSEFVLINVSGTSKVMVTDGCRREVIELDRPMKGVYIPKMIWKEMYDFSKDSVLLVMTNTLYDSTEYIRDYLEYLEIKKGRKHTC